MPGTPPAHAGPPPVPGARPGPADPGDQDARTWRDGGQGPAPVPPPLPPGPPPHPLPGARPGAAAWHAPAPPAPAAAPDGSGFLAWLRAPRPPAAPGVWRLGHRPRPADDPDAVPGRQLVAGALISFLGGWLLWSLLWNGYLGSYWLWPLLALTPESWRASGGNQTAYLWASYLYYAIIGGALLVFFARVGRWAELWRRHISVPLRRAREEERTAAGHEPADPAQDPAAFPALRQGGAADAADRLAEDARSGLMNDVDFARIARAWQSVRSEPGRLTAFTDTVLRYGAAACAHPSGARDLPARAARHDLLAGQVRIGAAPDDERNPRSHRGAGYALDPTVLGTSLLAVGPPGSGKTVRIVRPALESLCLQALAGRAAVVVVGTEGARLAPDDAFDVVVKIGHPDSAYDLDLYGGTTDPDEAAGFLAEALVGDLAAALPGGDSRRAATALAQLLGPFHAAHGRFPSVPELRELLDGTPSALAALRSALTDRGAAAQAQLRELDARERQSARPGDAGPLLADRIALLDRPAFAGFFDTTGGSHPFSLRGLEHPLRVRIDLPERGHAEVSRMLARLVLAQFAECAAARQDRSLFACLVLDDASHTVTAESVRGLQRMRSANAGAVLTLRTLDDVPEALRGTLLGAVGCRAALAGVTAWDGARFAEVWGKEWVDVQDVTNRQIIADEPLTRALHTVRRLVTGKAVTAESVTVRRVERERWSASDLAHGVPAGHAVVSLTAVQGEHAPPVLVDLRA
ncbi:ATP-binding protein [Streptomyces sp. NPDC026673]|uniref:ATP-binding protein n=1 Tax=Streptomyces sp. NPDC026673 TaxID=3155724 RepID=UPI0033FF76E4